MSIASTLVLAASSAASSAADAGPAFAAGSLPAPAGSVRAHAAGSEGPEGQPLLVLAHNHIVRAAPHADARRITTVSARRPLTRVRTILPVLGRATSSVGGAWVHVRLPGRPNGRSGWISAEGTRRASTEWRLALSLSARQVTVYRDGRVARRFRAVVGTPATPTPRGKFFIEEAVRLSSGVAGGPFALATSARSEILQEFNGGPGQIALHGTRGLQGAPGSAASHGCVRLSTRAITWLARRLGGGVPLTIRS